MVFPWPWHLTKGSWRAVLPLFLWHHLEEQAGPFHIFWDSLFITYKAPLRTHISRQFYQQQSTNRMYLETGEVMTAINIFQWGVPNLSENSATSVMSDSIFWLKHIFIDFFFMGPLLDSLGTYKHVLGQCNPEKRWDLSWNHKIANIKYTGQGVHSGQPLRQA